MAQQTLDLRTMVLTVLFSCIVAVPVAFFSFLVW